MQADPRYPVPDRSNFVPNQLTNDEVLREGDIGSHEGELPDGRPFRFEGWFSEGYTLGTVFFSEMGLEDADAPTLLALVSELLEDAQVPSRFRRLPQHEVHKISDASGNVMYSLTFIMGEPYPS